MVKWQNFKLWINRSVLFALFLFSSFSFGVVRTVPVPYPTIQSAIDASSDGDEVIVSPGTYVENINFKGKNIIVRSTEPMNSQIVEATIIDGGANGQPVVTFSGAELTTCVLSGFTITNGDSSAYGGGICGNKTLATIEYNHIISNICRGVGPEAGAGGISSCKGLIQHNLIADNVTYFNGGGLLDCSGTIQYNTITRNVAMWQSGGGLHGCNEATVQYNVISNNISYDHGGGIDYSYNTVIQYNVIQGNIALALRHPTVGMGGGIGKSWGCKIRYNEIVDNMASTVGGGIFL